MPGAPGALLRLLVDQFVFAPIFIGVFLSTLVTLEGRPSQVIPKLQQEWFSSVLVNWQLWIPFQFLNFRFVPQQFQRLEPGVVLGFNISKGLVGPIDKAIQYKDKFPDDTKDKKQLQIKVSEKLGSKNESCSVLSRIHEDPKKVQKEIRDLHPRPLLMTKVAPVCPAWLMSTAYLLTILERLNIISSQSQLFSNAPWKIIIFNMIPYQVAKAMLIKHLSPNLSKRKVYYFQVILIETGSVIFAPTSCNRNERAYSKFKIKRILSPAD
ncbi:unnamed protein product [Dovyalis caffra]|uniref:Uncharacterized protein n=1 Tax=Dovyalis caffra TaxID=77055 RepID=A0AAV1RVM4_9ROSI|nr:unnamed protein product [Dovyalis caffra]